MVFVFSGYLTVFELVSGLSDFGNVHQWMVVVLSMFKYTTSVLISIYVMNF